LLRHFVEAVVLIEEAVSLLSLSLAFPLLFLLALLGILLSFEFNFTFLLEFSEATLLF